MGNAPSQILPLFDQVAMEVTLSGFEDYDKIFEEIHVRVADVPQSEALRDLRQNHLNTLVKVTGVVTRRTSVYPQLRYVKYGCVKCGAVLGPFYQDNDREIQIRKCANCQSKGPFALNSEEVILIFCYNSNRFPLDHLQELSEIDLARKSRLCSSRSSST